MSRAKSKKYQSLSMSLNSQLVMDMVFSVSLYFIQIILKIGKKGLCHYMLPNCWLYGSSASFSCELNLHSMVVATMQDTLWMPLVLDAGDAHFGCHIWSKGADGGICPFSHWSFIEVKKGGGVIPYPIKHTTPFRNRSYVHQRFCIVASTMSKIIIERW